MKHARKSRTGLGLLAGLALATTAWGQTASTPPPAQMGVPTFPMPPAVAPGQPVAPAASAGTALGGRRPQQPVPVRLAGVSATAMAPPLVVPFAASAGVGSDLVPPLPIAEAQGPADVSPVGADAGLDLQQLQRLRTENAEMRKLVEDLSKKYQVLDVHVKRIEKEEEAQKAKEARKRRPQGPFPSTERKYEQMYHIGLFWWRDNTKEIAGRGAYRPDMEPTEHRIAENVTFGDGLRWTSEDGYFKLIFHNLTQLDYRAPGQQGDPLHGGFVIPRQRWYFNGTIGDYVDFVTAINRGYGSLDVLDSYADFIVNREWLTFRVGRFKMPSQYEYVEIAEGDLLGPERSLFVANYAANRQLGAMAHGFLFERRLRYYMAVGSGPRRSFEDYNSGRDYFAYLDYRPFITQSDSFLRNLHLVGTFNFGEERNPLAPNTLRTMNQMSTSADAAFVSPSFLQFRNDVFENGPRANWGFEPVYFYKNMGLLGSIQGGYQSYSHGNLAGAPGLQQTAAEFIDVNSPTRTHVPMYGWSVGGWWFVTGEEITRRRFLVEPKQPFGYHSGALNPGAIELFARYAEMQLGSQVFGANLVDQTLWTNRASTTDVGVNWYLNHFVKFTFDWQHTFLGSPVVRDPAAGTKFSHFDMFLFRTQVYF